jgi:hypothetical protein
MRAFRQYVFITCRFGMLLRFWGKLCLKFFIMKYKAFDNMVFRVSNI